MATPPVPKKDDAPQTVEVLDRIGVPKRAYVFHGAATAAATRLWIRQ